MNRRRALVAIALVPTAAPAQHKHDHKPKHGGLVKEMAGFVYELRVTRSEIAVWVTDEDDKPVPVRGSTAKVTLIDSGTRVEVALTAADGNRHAASGTFPIKPGMSALLEVAVGGRNVARLRYALK